MWRDALLVAGKDIRIEWRSRVGTNQILPFAVLVLMLFAFALGPGREVLAPASSGLFWLAVLLTTLLSVQRSFAVESADGAGDGLKLSGMDPAGVFLGKAAAITLQLVVVEAVVGAGVVFLYGARLGDLAMVVVGALAGAIGLAAAGTVYGALSVGLRVRETLLPLLLLPVVVPVLLAGTKSWDAAISGHTASGLPWMHLLAVFAVVYVTLGVLAYGALMEAA